MRRINLVLLAMMCLMTYLNAQEDGTNHNDNLSALLETGVFIQNVQQNMRSYKFYSFQIKDRVLNSPAEKALGVITAIVIDINNDESDPDIYISKESLAIDNVVNSDQQCLKAGSQVCILDNSLFQVGDIVHFGVKCIDQCNYSLKIVQPQLFSLQDSTPINQYMDTKSVTMFQFKIPMNVSDGVSASGGVQIPSAVYFTVQSFSLTAPVKLYFSPSNDFSLVEERDYDVVIDAGKGFKFTSNDLGWCTNCNIYLIVSTEIASSFIINAKATSKQELLQDQNQVSRQLNALEKRCFSYSIQKSVNDVVFQISQYQGDVDAQAYYRNLSNNQQSDQVIISSENAQQRQLIVRSQDRQRYGPANGIIYLCLQAYYDASLQITPLQIYTQDRFDLQNNELTTFFLDSKDSIYFRYTSDSLDQSQQLKVTVQTLGNSMFNVPRVFYRVCSFTDPDECVLNEQQQTGDKNASLPLTELVSTVDSYKIRTGLITHNAASCPNPNQCIYLISVYNGDLSGPLRTTIKIQPNSQADPQRIRIFQQYYDTLEQGITQYFSVYETLSQSLKIQVNKVIVTLTVYNGKADLYGSNSTKYPGPGIAGSLKGIKELQTSTVVLDASQIDLTQNNVFFSLVASVQTIYRVNVDAEYELIEPSDSSDNTFDDSNDNSSTTDGSETNTDSEVGPIYLVNGQDQSLTIDSSDIGKTVTVFYNVSMDQFRQRNIFILPSTTNSDAGASFLYDIYLNDQTQPLFSNQDGDLIITADSYKLNNSIQNTFRIVFKGVFTMQLKPIKKGQNNSSQKNEKLGDTISTIEMNVQIQTATYSADQNVIETDLSTVYSAFGQDSSSLVLFKTELLESNGTYIYTVNPLKGDVNMFYKTGSSTPDFNPDDDTSYFLTGSLESEESSIQTITSDKIQRESQPDQLCKNQSYSLRGGNNNCNMYIGVQCLNDQKCIFEFKVELSQAKNRNITPPKVVRQKSQFLGSLSRGKADYFYIPFIKGKFNNNFAFVLNKLNDDTMLVARVISNGYMNYFNWSYPTNSSNDVISRSNKSNPIEILEISNTTINAKCVSNATSCVLILGVISNALSNSSLSSYELFYLDAQRRISNVSLINGEISDYNSYDNYWFMFNSSSSFQWRQTLSLMTPYYGSAHLYVSVFNGRMPTYEDYDYKSESLQTDFLQISSDDSGLKAYRSQSRVIFTISVHSLRSDVSYTLQNYGPNPMTSKSLQFIDLSLNKPQNYTLPSLASTGNISSYTLFRYFNYGIDQLKLTITTVDGNVYYLGNKHEFQLQNYNAYFKIPVNQQFSVITPINVNKSQSSIIFLPDDDQNVQSSNLYCQFCWIYFAVFQNNSNSKVGSTFTLTLSQFDKGQANIPIIQEGKVYSNITVKESNLVERKFILSAKDTLALSITNLNKSNFTAFVGMNVNFAAEDPIWIVDSNTSAVFTLSQSDPYLKVGAYYYISLISNKGDANFTISLVQRQPVQLLKDKQTIQDFMWTPNDIVKYYSFVPPKQQANYSATLTINAQTPFFQPNIYLLRNDILNGSFSYESFQYPSIVNFDLKQESIFYDASPSAKQYSFVFNMTGMNSPFVIQSTSLQNVTVNQMQPQSVNTTVYNKTTKKNDTVTVIKNVSVAVNVTQNVTKNNTFYSLNQTHYTIAIYWNKNGLTDYEKAEYDITLTTNLNSSQYRLQQPRKLYRNNLLESISQKIEEEEKERRKLEFKIEDRIPRFRSIKGKQ